MSNLAIDYELSLAFLAFPWGSGRKQGVKKKPVKGGFKRKSARFSKEIWYEWIIDFLDMSVTTWRKVAGCLQSIYIWSYFSSPQSLGGGSRFGVSRLSTLVTMRIGKGRRPSLFPRALPLFPLPTSELSAYTVTAARKRPLWRRNWSYCVSMDRCAKR